MKEIQNRKSGTKAAALLKKGMIVLVLIALVIISGIVSPTFLKPGNIVNVLRQVSVVAILACGEVMLIICGYIDLSCGSICALAGCVGCSVSVATGNVFLGVLTAVLVGAVSGLLSGVMVALFNVPAFIATLAMMTIDTGLVLLFTGGFSIFNLGDFTIIGQGKLAGIPIPVLIMLAVVGLSWILLERTKFGRSLFAIGGNRKAAVASGINTRRVTIKVFLFAGAMAGLAGAVLAARLNSGMPTAGEGYEMDAISAAVVGGTSFSGGIGSIFGGLIGALIIGVLNNVMNLIGVGAYYQKIIRGIIIAVAVIIDITSKSGFWSGGHWRRLGRRTEPSGAAAQGTGVPPAR